MNVCNDIFCSVHCRPSADPRLIHPALSTEVCLILYILFLCEYLECKTRCFLFDVIFCYLICIYIFYLQTYHRYSDEDFMDSGEF